MLAGSSLPDGARTIDPTWAVVGEGKLKGNGRRQLSLLWLATHYCRVSLDVVRSLNPHLDDLPADAPIPLWTRVRLPNMLTEQRRLETMTGNALVIGEAEERLRRCRASLQECVRNFESERGAELLALPRRRVLTQVEQLREALAAEVEKQSASVSAEYHELGERDAQLPRLVQAGALQERQRAIQQRFEAEATGLHSFRPSNTETLSDLVRHGSARFDSNLSPADMHTVSDTEEDTCDLHTHRWEFAVCRREELSVWAELAFLSCQRLTTMLDVMQALCLSSNADGYPFALSRDSFLYISGTFYVDDRHEGFTDLTESIRNFCLPRTQESGERESSVDGNVFARCPVVSAGSTRWRDVTVRQGELCALRHMGGCTHYFYLSGVSELADHEVEQRSRANYPLCIAKAQDEALLCQLCRTYPSTVALYNDSLSPTNPAVYCPLCFSLLHEDADNAPAPASSSCIKLTPYRHNDYFRSY